MVCMTFMATDSHHFSVFFLGDRGIDFALFIYLSGDS
jgi:hypothetical protein